MLLREIIFANMFEELEVKSGKKSEMYEQLLPQIHALVNGETNIVSNLSNIASALHHTFNFWWTGFYLVDGNELALGSFQGPIACTRIAYGKGVCGKAWESKQTQLVPNVHEFPGHIACSSATNSEIVLPIFHENGEVWGVLDVDSEHLNRFDAEDQHYLELLCESISKHLKDWKYPV